MTTILTELSADFSSAFSAGVTVAATWDRTLLYQRGYDMGTEHRLKGVDVQLGPVVGPLGRTPAGGRNWEGMCLVYRSMPARRTDGFHTGFSPDPVLSGIAVAESVKGIQDAGIIACTKHYILNEQEHFRQGGTVLPAISCRGLKLRMFSRSQRVRRHLLQHRRCHHARIIPMVAFIKIDSRAQC